jgi:hypothetical protein
MLVWNWVLGVVSCGVAIGVLSPVARAATFQVGPTRAFHDLSAVAPSVAPGDVVELDGGVTYPSARWQTA